MTDTDIIQRIVAEGLAENVYSATHIANGLELAAMADDEARMERVRLYRRHRPRGSKHVKTIDAYREAIAGREPLTLEM